jgi:hypothetical protein
LNEIAPPGQLRRSAASNVRMVNRDLEEAVDSVCSTLHDLWQQQATPAFHDALHQLESFAERGDIRAAEAVAEILALKGPLHDAARAYKWYYVALSQTGYSVTFDDKNNTPPYYCGPMGDFRNESMVSGLVVELGFEQVRKLDAKAAAWLDARKSS